MANRYALKYNGVDSYVDLVTSTSTHGNTDKCFIYEIDLSNQPDGAERIYLRTPDLTGSGRPSHYLEFTKSGNNITFTKQVVDVTTFDLTFTTDAVFTIKHVTRDVGNKHNLYINNVKVLDNVTVFDNRLSQQYPLANQNSTVQGVQYLLRRFTVKSADETTTFRDYYNDTGTGNTLVDHVGGYDATLVNFPTDNSQWVYVDENRLPASSAIKFNDLSEHIIHSGLHFGYTDDFEVQTTFKHDGSANKAYVFDKNSTDINNDFSALSIIIADTDVLDSFDTPFGTLSFTQVKAIYPEYEHTNRHTYKIVRKNNTAQVYIDNILIIEQVDNFERFAISRVGYHGGNSAKGIGEYTDYKITKNDILIFDADIPNYQSGSVLANTANVPVINFDNDVTLSSDYETAPLALNGTDHFVFSATACFGTHPGATDRYALRLRSGWNEFFELYLNYSGTLRGNLISDLSGNLTIDLSKPLNVYLDLDYPNNQMRMRLEQKETFINDVFTYEGSWVTMPTSPRGSSFLLKDAFIQGYQLQNRAGAYIQHMRLYNRTTKTVVHDWQPGASNQTALVDVVAGNNMSLPEIAVNDNVVKYIQYADGSIESGDGDEQQYVIPKSLSLASNANVTSPYTDRTYLNLPDMYDPTGINGIKDFFSITMDVDIPPWSGNENREWLLNSAFLSVERYFSGGWRASLGRAYNRAIGFYFYNDHNSDPLLPQLSGRKVLKFDLRNNNGVIQLDFYLGDDIDSLVLFASQDSHNVALTSINDYHASFSGNTYNKTEPVNFDIDFGSPQFDANVTQNRQISKATFHEIIIETPQGFYSRFSGLGLDGTSWHDDAIKHIANVVNPPLDNSHLINIDERYSLHFDGVDDYVSLTTAIVASEDDYIVIEYESFDRTSQYRYFLDGDSNNDRSYIVTNDNIIEYNTGTVKSLTMGDDVTGQLQINSGSSSNNPSQFFNNRTTPFTVIATFKSGARIGKVAARYSGGTPSNCSISRITYYNSSGTAIHDWYNTNGVGQTLVDHVGGNHGNLINFNNDNEHWHGNTPVINTSVDETFSGAITSTSMVAPSAQYTEVASLSAAINNAINLNGSSTYNEAGAFSQVLSASAVLTPLINYSESITLTEIINAATSVAGFANYSQSQTGDIAATINASGSLTANSAYSEQTTLNGTINQITGISTGAQYNEQYSALSDINAAHSITSNANYSFNGSQGAILSATSGMVSSAEYYESANIATNTVLTATIMGEYSTSEAIDLAGVISNNSMINAVMGNSESANAINAITLTGNYRTTINVRGLIR